MMIPLKVCTMVFILTSVCLQIFYFLTYLSIFFADEEEEKVRRTRDGNVVKTGCEELDSFINNLSDFTNKIVNMFYDGKKEMHMKETDSESEDDTDEPMHLDLLPISKNK